MRGSMGALMAAETRAAVARTVLDSFNSDCKAELLRLLQQEKDAKPDTIAIATQLLGEIRTATHATDVLVKSCMTAGLQQRRQAKRQLDVKIPAKLSSKNVQSLGKRNAMAKAARASGKEERKKT